MIIVGKGLVEAISWFGEDLGQKIVVEEEEGGFEIATT